ncbi:unnamed protein product [Adineta ricciae]|nr:unnamed protein product [Adineta ricciae]
MGDQCETPHLPFFFISLDYSLQKFTHLQFLSLHDIQSPIAIHLLQNLSQLNELLSLTITNCDISIDEQNEIHFFNQVWQLPKLNRLHLNTGCLKYATPFQLHCISSTLKHISIESSHSIRYSIFVDILRHSPSLQSISMSIESTNNEYEIFTNDLPMIISLKLTFLGHVRVLKNLLQHTPNLRRLKIRLINTYLTGYEWKEIVVNYLLHIKIFNFQMFMSYLRNRNSAILLDELINTFRTSFWLDEHQWYICIDKYPNDFVILYTLPNYFPEFTSMIVLQQKTTCPEFKKNWLFDRVKRLYCSSHNDKHPYEISTFFNKFEDLNIDLPLSTRTWNSVLTFKHLISLTIHNSDGKCGSIDLQLILNHAPRLYALTVHESSRLNYKIVLKLTSSTIRRLKFFSEYLNRDYLSKEDCLALSQSSLAHQCEVLTLAIEDFHCVYCLVNAMSNLRVLNMKISCKEANLDDQLKYFSRKYPNLWIYLDDR